MTLNQKFKKQNTNMKKQLTFAILLFSSLSGFAQVTQENLEKEIKPLTQRVNTLQVENGKLKTDIGILNSKLSNTNKTLDSLRIQTQENVNAIAQTANELGIRIKETGDKNEGEINKVEKSLSKNSLYGIIGVLSAILLSGLLYWLLSKKQKTDKTDFDEQLKNKTTELKKDVYSQIENTKSELITESAKLDFQLLNLIEKQLKVADKLNATEPSTDHTFHKNSANELQRIANYANTLPPESQEAIALQGSLGRLRNYFNASDYEITDFTGKDYDERIPMRMRETIFDESIEVGKEIVVKTWEPQIKFKNDIIQQAKIDTKYNK
ncbi:MAG: septum formation initiator [Bacteroidetes bacterium]|nr:septum formation initiator [Bacteroidota bacterium]